MKRVFAPYCIKRTDILKNMGLKFKFPTLSRSNPGPQPDQRSGGSADDWITESMTGGISAAGVPVTQQTALTIAAFYKGVRFLSEIMASLDLEVIKKNDDNTKEILGKHHVKKLMEFPGSFYNKFSFRETVQAFAVVRGNGLAKIHRDKVTNRPMEFEILDPSHVEPHIKDGQLFYIVWDGHGKPTVHFDFNIFHIPNLPMTGTALGVWGLSPIEYFRDTLGFNIAVNKYGGTVFKNGTHTNGYLSTEMELDGDQIKRLATSWADRSAGLENVGRTPVLEQGMKYYPMSMKPEDLQFFETRKLNLTDVSNMLSVPSYILGDTEKLSYNSIEQQSLDLARYTIRSWCQRWESEAKKKLFSTKERMSHSLKFNLNSLLQGDSASRARLYDTYMKWGLFDADEIRAMEDKNPFPDGKGKGRLVPANFVNVDDLEDVYKTGTGNE